MSLAQHSRRAASLPAVAGLPRSAVLCESLRSLPLCVILEPLSSTLRRSPFRRPRRPGMPRIGADRRHSQLQQILPLQLQLDEFFRSVDYGGLKWHLSPFRISTSKNLCIFCISLIRGQLKSSIINTSKKNGSKLPRINTSKKRAGGWVVVEFRPPRGNRSRARNGMSSTGTPACVHLVFGGSADGKRSKGTQPGVAVLRKAGAGRQRRTR
jgi:hypothetical protein